MASLVHLPLTNLFLMGFNIFFIGVSFCFECVVTDLNYQVEYIVNRHCVEINGKICSFLLSVLSM